MDTVKRIEEISSTNLRKHPRVTLEQVINYIDKVYYVTGEQLVPLEDAVPMDAVDQLKVMTICTAILKNGWIVLGTTAPASPDNFDAEIGRKLAYENVIKQVWPLLGFNLRTHLAIGEEDRRTRHRDQDYDDEHGAGR